MNDEALYWKYFEVSGHKLFGTEIWKTISTSTK